MFGHNEAKGNILAWLMPHIMGKEQEANGGTALAEDQETLPIPHWQQNQRKGIQQKHKDMNLDLGIQQLQSDFAQRAIGLWKGFPTGSDGWMWEWKSQTQTSK